MLVIGYPLFERMHYLLLAGYDVYGNIGHQLATRLYMDFLRMEGELNFSPFCRSRIASRSSTSGTAAARNRPTATSPTPPSIFRAKPASITAPAITSASFTGPWPSAWRHCATWRSTGRRPA